MADNNNFEPLYTNVEMERIFTLTEFGSRYSTYYNFPENSTYPSWLARAGFYSTGRHDEVICVYCGITLSGWKEQENPMIRHALSSPHCKHVLMKYYNISVRVPFGESEIRDIVFPSRLSAQEFRFTEFLTSQDQQTQLSDSNSKMSDMTTNQAVGSEKFQNQEQKKAEGKYEDTLTSVLYERNCSSDNENRETRSDTLIEENAQTQRSAGRQLVKNTLCNKCWEVDSSIIFLPCCHVISCKSCADSLKYCFLCEEVIKEKKEIRRP